MTTAEAYGDNRGRVARAAIWLGHVSQRYDVFIFAAVWGLLLTSWWIPLPPVAEVVLAATLVVVVVGHLVVLVCQTYHDSRLCWRDFTSSVVLLNPQAEVDRNIRRLRFVHHARFRILMLVVGALPIVALLANPQLRDVQWRLAYTALGLVGVAASMYADRAQRTHQQLQLWCPFCRRRGGGGPYRHTPTPTPIGTVNG